MIGFGLLWTIGLWFVYRIAMVCKKREAALRAGPRWQLYAAYLWLAAGLVLDVVYNVVVGTILFLDLPRELTLTARLRRYRADASTHIDLRYRLATFICTRLLNPYDPGGSHC